jgi:ParB-like chromosome segregation protein Spo0J
MQVQLRDIRSIKPYENNRRFNDAAVDAVAKSIQEFGFRQPIIVDENDVIIVGHSRFSGSGMLIDKRRAPSWKGRGTLLR